MTAPDLSPQGLWESTQALIPRIAAAGDEIERERRIPPWLVDGLTEAGLFRMTLPKSLDGAELPLHNFMDIMEAIAQADASTAWVLGQNAGIGRMAAYLPEQGAWEVFGAPDARAAWGPGPNKAVRVKGGYRVSGRWSFASGMRHATWLGDSEAKPVDEDGAPILDKNGAQQLVTLFFPASEARITDIWQVSGLKGTASDAYEVEDLFVPEHRASLSEPREKGPLYVFRRNNIFAAGFGSASLGIARASLDAFIDLAIDKQSRGFNGPLREQPTYQLEVAQCEAAWRSARAFLRQAVDDAWVAACEGRLSLQERGMLRLAATNAIHRSREVVDQAYYLAGSAAIFTSNAFERRFRDMHAITQQVQGRQDHYEAVGQMLMGLEPSQQWF